MNYTTAAMRLLQRWTRWDGDKDEQRLLQQESWKLMFDYTEPTRLQRNVRSLRYYYRKKARLLAEQ